MSNNPFRLCNTESEIMKTIFELSTGSSFSRHELIELANERRAELSKTRPASLNIKKITQPASDGSHFNKEVKDSIQFSTNPKGSNVFEFMPYGIVKF